MRPEVLVRADAAPPTDMPQTGDQHGDRHDIENGPNDLERHAAIIAKMQRLRDQQRSGAKRQICGLSGQLARFGLRSAPAATGATSAASHLHKQYSIVALVASGITRKKRQR